MYIYIYIYRFSYYIILYYITLYYLLYNIPIYRHMRLYNLICMSIYVPFRSQNLICFPCMDHLCSVPVMFHLWAHRWNITGTYMEHKWDIGTTMEPKWTVICLYYVPHELPSKYTHDALVFLLSSEMGWPQ